MNAKLKAKWIEALRSGKYEQTDNELRRAHKAHGVHGYAYCCLGVLCDTMGADWINGTPVIDNARLEDEDEAILRRFALRLTGLSDAAQNELAKMNDAGQPFSEIADHIEKHL